jgi:hypothetical protein
MTDMPEPGGPADERTLAQFFNDIEREPTAGGCEVTAEEVAENIRQGRNARTRRLASVRFRSEPASEP